MDGKTQESFYLVYASTATREVSNDDLFALLRKARETNEKLGITGLLLFSPGQGREAGTFLQVLEGHKATVEQLYWHITHDELHQDCTLVRTGTQLGRRYADWTMGFRNLSEVDPKAVPGFNPVFQAHWPLQRILAEPDPVLQMVYSFASEAS